MTADDGDGVLTAEIGSGGVELLAGSASAACVWRSREGVADGGWVSDDERRFQWLPTARKMLKLCSGDCEECLKCSDPEDNLAVAVSDRVDWGSLGGWRGWRRYCGGSRFGAGGIC